ncbi:MAG: GNAT family N-acetyltransferase [Chloroflexi bacterium]|nr:GNAT family N-acetyltransferase [Chloroflexota bacterium]
MASEPVSGHRTATPIALVAPERALPTARLWLEPLLPAHAAALWPQIRDERLYRFIPEDPPASLDALRRRFQTLSSRRSPDGREAWLNWAMRRRGSEEYVGTLQASVFPNRMASIAYVVFIPHQGRGYAAEGVRRLLEHLVEYRVHTVAAEIDTRNVPSIRVVERAGFERVDTRRAVEFFKGEWSDEYRYEWRTAG